MLRGTIIWYLSKTRFSFAISPNANGIVTVDFNVTPNYYPSSQTALLHLLKPLSSVPNALKNTTRSARIVNSVKLNLFYGNSSSSRSALEDILDRMNTNPILIDFSSDVNISIISSSHNIIIPSVSSRHHKPNVVSCAILIPHMFSFSYLWITLADICDTITKIDNQEILAISIYFHNSLSSNEFAPRLEILEDLITVNSDKPSIIAGVWNSNTLFSRTLNSNARNKDLNFL